MSPVYEEAGAWWFDTSLDGCMGPYDTEVLALAAYHRYQKNNCPTCEE